MITLNEINLSQVAAFSKKQRFYLQYPRQKVYDALLLAYKAEVLGRIISYQEEDLSRIKIEIDEARLSSIAAWITNSIGKPGVLLYGDVGTGKTTALKAFCRVINACCYAERDDHRLDDGKKMISIVLAKDVVSAYQNDSERYKRMLNAEMIAIDELGVEAIDVKTYGNSNEPIIDLLSHRYDTQKITAVSSNLDLDQINERYGLRLADRFNEMFHKVGFVGASYRGYANKDRK